MSMNLNDLLDLAKMSAIAAGNFLLKINLFLMKRSQILEEI